MAAENKLRLMITSNYGKVFDGNVKMVSLKIETGYIGILANHVPIVSNIKPCIIKVEVGEEKTKQDGKGIYKVAGDGKLEFVIGGGLITTFGNEVKILTTEIDDYKEISVSKTESELKSLNAEYDKIEKKSSQAAKVLADAIKYSQLKIE